MDNTNIDLLVHKKLTNQLTEREANQLSQYMNDDAFKSEADKVVYAWEAASSIDEELVFDSKAAFNKFIQQTRVEKEEPQRIAKVFTLRTALSVAAMTTLAFFAFKMLFNSNTVTISADNTSFTAVLPEGSEIRLAPHSTLTYDKSTFEQARHLQLTGSGIIHVEKTGSPFIVKGKDFEVEVMGTTFYVASTGNHDNVRVLEGKVEVRKASNKVQITDKQGVDIEGGILTKKENIVFADLTWVNDNDMTYNGTPLSKVLADIEAKFGISINVKSSELIKTCTFTSGSLSKLGLDQILSILESTFTTKFIKKSDKEYNLGSLSCK